MEFYITLPSNVKHDSFDNTITNYKTKLATTVRLEDEWLVGLSSITYTKSWKEKIEPAIVEVTYFLWGEKIVPDKINMNLEKYKTVEEVIEYINNELEKKAKIFRAVDDVEYTLEFPRLELNLKTNRVELKFSTFKNGIVSLIMSDNLTRTLGIDKTKLDDFIKEKYRIYNEKFKHVTHWGWLDKTEQDPPKEEDLIYKAEEPYNVINDFHTLYVYCDLVKHNFVGDSVTQLLRLVEIPPHSKFRDQITIDYTNVFFHRILMNEFHSIHIYIRNDQNEKIPFLFGRVILTLKFKKLIKT